MSTRVLLARHGEAEYETDLLADVGGSLTTLGRQQARDLGRRLRDAEVSEVWCSSLSRAVQTAELAAAELGVDHVTVREGLREYGVGSLAGQPESEAHRLFAFFDRWMAGDDEVEIPGGGRVTDWVGRVVGTLHEIAAAGPDTRRSVLAVSHGGAMLAAVPVLCGLPRTVEEGHSIANGACLVLEHDGEDPTQGWRVLPEELTGSDRRLR